MERKRKIRRFFILAVCFYIIVNAFLFGLMNAYLNTNNIVSKNQLIMASVTQTEKTTKINILGKEISINKNETLKAVSQAVLYTVMPEKVRFCTDIILNCSDLVA